MTKMFIGLSVQSKCDTVMADSCGVTEHMLMVNSGEYLLLQGQEIQHECTRNTF